MHIMQSGGWPYSEVGMHVYAQIDTLLIKFSWDYMYTEEYGTVYSVKPAPLSLSRKVRVRDGLA